MKLEESQWKFNIRIELLALFPLYFFFIAKR